MFIIERKWCGLGRKKGNLKGVGGHPFVTYHLMLFRIHVLRGRAEDVLHDAMQGLTQDPEWLIANQDHVRLHKKKAQARLRKKYEAQFREEKQWLRDRHKEQCLAIGALNQENQSLKGALRALCNDQEKERV